MVRLDVAACDGEYVGAGFLIDERHIVTVAHNVVDAELIAATTESEIAIAVPVGVDVLRDIALLRTDIPIGDTYFDLAGSEPVVGQDLILFGFPLGLDLTVTRGIVSNADVELPDEPLLRFVQIDAAANPGNSGGPVVTAGGELIGILQSGIVGFEGLNFATKLTVVERLLRSWVDAPALKSGGCSSLEEEAAPTGAAAAQTTSNPRNTTPTAVTTSLPARSGPDAIPVVYHFGLTWPLENGDKERVGASLAPFPAPWHQYTLSIEDKDGVNPAGAKLRIGEIECSMRDALAGPSFGNWTIWFGCNSWPSGGGTSSRLS